MNRIWTIAQNTLLELVRQKIFYFLVIFALAMIASSVFMDFLQPEMQFQIIKDVSLGAMSIFTWLLAVLATAMLLPKDMEDRTLYTVLAKPVPRSAYIFGKLLGVLLLVGISTLIMSAMFVATLWFKQTLAIAAIPAEMRTPEQLKLIYDATFTFTLIPAIVAIYLKAALFAALTLLISTFATSWIFTVVISVVVYFIGHLVPLAREYSQAGVTGTVGRAILTLVAVLFPDLQLFNLSDDIVAGNTVSTAFFAQIVGMGSFYIVVYALLAYFVFAKKEL